MSSDYYDILKVPRNATDEQIKAAYKKLAMQYHPDKQRNCSPKEQEAAAQRFKDAAEAYSILSTPSSRSQYDLQGMSSRYSGGNSNSYRSQSIDPEQVFARFFDEDDGLFSSFSAFPFNDMMFGGKRPNRVGRSQSNVTPAPFEQNLYVTLEQLYTGCTKKLKVTRTRWQNNRQVREDHFCEVRVKAGWKDDTRITFQCEGDQLHPNARPGDLIFTIKTKPHARFQREGNNLLSTVKLPLVKALCGFELKFQTLDDRIIFITIDEIVTPEFCKVVVGEGMPSQKAGRASGSLVLSFVILYPVNLSTQKKLQLEALLGDEQYI